MRAGRGQILNIEYSISNWGEERRVMNLNSGRDRRAVTTDYTARQAATKEENLTTDEHPPSPRLRWASRMDTDGERRGEEAGNEFELRNSGKNRRAATTDHTDHTDGESRGRRPEVRGKKGGSNIQYPGFNFQGGRRAVNHRGPQRFTEGIDKLRMRRFLRMGERGEAGG